MGMTEILGRNSHKEDYQDIKNIPGIEKSKLQRNQLIYKLICHLKHKRNSIQKKIWMIQFFYNTR